MMLVTGANGFVGSYVVRRLARDKTPMRVLLRPNADASSVSLPGVSVAKGDVQDQSSLGAAMSGVDSVVHLVAVPIERGRQTFNRVNVQGTRNAVSAARAAGVKRFIHMSALGASDDARYPYMHSKWLGEEIVRSSGLDYTVLRPSAQFGEGDGFFSAFAGLIGISPFIFPSPGRGDTVFQPISVEDVAEAVARSLADPRTIGETVEFGGPEHLTYDQMVRAVLDVMGKVRRIIHVPIPLMRVPLFFFGLLPYPPVDSGQLDLLNVRNATDLESTEHWFGFKPKRLTDGLGYLKRFDERKWLRGRLESP